MSIECSSRNSLTSDIVTPRISRMFTLVYSNLLFIRINRVCLSLKKGGDVVSWYYMYMYALHALFTVLCKWDLCKLTWPLELGDILWDSRMVENQWIKCSGDIFTWYSIRSLLSSIWLHNNTTVMVKDFSWNIVP